tara:strand:+ start:1214 stop:1663 length:450 start_codon:yes stop_codon:yes gene_type:complete
MKSIGTIFVVLMLFMSVFIAMQQVGEESFSNSQLSDDSKSLILNYSSNIDGNLNLNNDFGESQSNLTTNATFDSEDVFAQEFLEGKSEAQQQTGIIRNIVKVPDLIFLSIGFPESSLIWIRSLIALIITTILAFAGYRAIFGGGKITDN